MQSNVLSKCFLAPFLCYTGRVLGSYSVLEFIKFNFDCLLLQNNPSQFKLPYLPFVRAESADEEQHDGHADVGKEDANPDLLGQGRHETEHSRVLLHRALDHDGNAQRHEGLREVNHLFS